jgi:hypothetical protein
MMIVGGEGHILHCGRFEATGELRGNAKQPEVLKPTERCIPRLVCNGQKQRTREKGSKARMGCFESLRGLNEMPDVYVISHLNESLEV